MNTIRLLPVIVGTMLLTACSGGGLGTLGDILGGMGGPGAGGQSQVTGEVQQVDSRSQRIYLRSQSGQSGSLLYDGRTEVIYRQQQYPVTALERGDVVTVQVRQDSRNEMYAERVYVEQSVQERSGDYGSGGMQRMEGRVGQIDFDRGWFELLSDRGGSVVVTLPYDAGRSTMDRFRRLRRGDFVRLEGSRLNQERVELYRFY